MKLIAPPSSKFWIFFFYHHSIYGTGSFMNAVSCKLRYGIVCPGALAAFSICIEFSIDCIICFV